MNENRTKISRIYHACMTSVIWTLVRMINAVHVRAHTHKHTNSYIFIIKNNTRSPLIQFYLVRKSTDRDYSTTIINAFFFFLLAQCSYTSCIPPNSFIEMSSTVRSTHASYQRTSEVYIFQFVIRQRDFWLSACQWRYACVQTSQYHILWFVLCNGMHVLCVQCTAGERLIFLRVISITFVSPHAYTNNNSNSHTR